MQHWANLEFAMRAKHVLIAGLVCLMLGAQSLAEDLPNRFEVAAAVEKDSAGIYKLKWQRQLLAIQTAFAAELAGGPAVDYTATGSITPISPARPTR